MTREEVFSWILEEYDIIPEYPWQDNNAVLRHRENRKWFAAILDVPRKSLNLPGEGTLDVINLKLDPMVIGSLLTQPGYFRAYHMNKEHWISVSLSEEVSDEQTKTLISMSFEITK